MTDEDEQTLRARLAKLNEEHRDLDVAISALMESGTADLLQLSRFKKNCFSKIISHKLKIRFCLISLR